MARVVVGLSGGVDSAVAAWLLLKEGHDVIGVTLRTWESAGSRCCKIDAAWETARFLGIPYHVINCAADFKKKVELPFVEDYIKGITPNPCVFCNSNIKWEWMLYAAGIFQAERVATGHYASLVRKNNGLVSIRQAKDKAKDQSYMLYRLTQEQLRKTVFPLGNLTKQKVRELALAVGLPSAETPDSQEICFVSEGSYADYIEDNARMELQGPGNFVDKTGRVLGTHKGIVHYTVGQRKGLGLSLGYPVYVRKKNAEKNEVMLSGEADLYQKAIICRDITLMSIKSLEDKEVLHCTVKIRCQHHGEEAVIEKMGDDCFLVTFEKPVRAPAPGQSAVFYDENGCLIGGGVIVGEDNSYRT